MQDACARNELRPGLHEKRNDGPGDGTCGWPCRGLPSPRARPVVLPGAFQARCCCDQGTDRGSDDASGWCGDAAVERSRDRERLRARDVAVVGHSMARRRHGVRRALRWRPGPRVGVGRRVRSLGDEPTSAPEDVGAFVAPFREDFGAAVDRFARTSSAARCSNGPCSPFEEIQRGARAGCARHSLHDERAVLASRAAPLLAVDAIGAPALRGARLAGALRGLAVVRLGELFGLHGYALRTRTP
jgi:hypothetical protein